MLLASLCSCKRSTAAQMAGVADAGPAAHDTSVGALAPSIRDAGAPKSFEAKGPLTDPARKQSYQQAMAQGRALTRQKRFDAAITAFDRAIEERRWEPRPYAERGYAKLLAGKYQEAEDDFREVSKVGGDQDPILKAQVWYNLGLAAEKQGDKRGALRAFLMSNDLHATKAAAKKVEKADVCAVDISEGPSVKLLPNWLAVYDALHNTKPGDGGRPPTEEDARAALVERNKESPDGQLVASDDNQSPASVAYFAFKTPKGVALTDEIGSLFVYRLWEQNHFDVKPANGDVVSVDVIASVAPAETMTCTCTKQKTGEREICDEDSEVPAGVDRACEVGYPTFMEGDTTTYYFRRSDGKSLGGIIRARQLEPFEVKVSDHGIELTGSTCHEVVPLPGGTQ